MSKKIKKNPKNLKDLKLGVKCNIEKNADGGIRPPPNILAWNLERSDKLSATEVSRIFRRVCQYQLINCARKGRSRRSRDKTLGIHHRVCEYLLFIES